MQTQQERKPVTINGREIPFPPPTATPEELKMAAGIDPSRNLIRQDAGANEILANGEPIKVKDGDHFADAPTFKYG